MCTPNNGSGGTIGEFLLQHQGDTHRKRLANKLSFQYNFVTLQRVTAINIKIKYNNGEFPSQSTTRLYNRKIAYPKVTEPGAHGTYHRKVDFGLFSLNFHCEFLRFIGTIAGRICFRNHCCVILQLFVLFICYFFFIGKYIQLFST